MKDITVRQFYAAQAMNAFLTNAPTDREQFIKTMARNAFRVADAMLEAEIESTKNDYTHPTGVIGGQSFDVED